jgi:hypothetical protein
VKNESVLKKELKFFRCLNESVERMKVEKMNGLKKSGKMKVLKEFEVRR